MLVLPVRLCVCRKVRMSAAQVKVFGGESEGVLVGKQPAVERQPGVMVGVIQQVVQLLLLSVNGHFLRSVVEVERRMHRPRVPFVREKARKRVLRVQLRQFYTLPNVVSVTAGERRKAVGARPFKAKILVAIRLGGVRIVCEVYVNTVVAYSGMVGFIGLHGVTAVEIVHRRVARLLRLVGVQITGCPPLLASGLGLARLFHRHFPRAVEAQALRVNRGGQLRRGEPLRNTDRGVVSLGAAGGQEAVVLRQVAPRTVITGHIHALPPLANLQCVGSSLRSRVLQGSCHHRTGTQRQRPLVACFGAQADVHRHIVSEHLALQSLHGLVVLDDLRTVNILRFKQFVELVIAASGKV